MAEAPAITSDATATVLENQTAVITVTATGDPVPTFSLTGGADELLFTVDETTGALEFADAPNYESPGDADANNAYVVEVTATNTEDTDAQTITVTVSDSLTYLVEFGPHTGNVRASDEQLAWAVFCDTTQYSKPEIYRHVSRYERTVTEQ